MRFSSDVFLHEIRFRSYIRKKLAPIEQAYHIRRIEMDILLYLETAGEKNSLRNLVQFVSLNKGQASIALRKLESEGWIRREYDQKDHRLQHFFLEEAAVEVVREIRMHYMEAMNDAYAGISESDLELFWNISKRVDENLRRVDEKARNRKEEKE